MSAVGPGHPHDPKIWYDLLEQLVLHSRETNEDMRFGQTLFNAIALHDKVNYNGNSYNEDFHTRLFYIEDKDLAGILKEWYEDQLKTL